MRGRNKLGIAIALTLAGATGATFAQSMPSDYSSYTPSQDAYHTTANTAGIQPENPAGPETVPLFDWAVGMGYEHTDNIGRTSLDPTGQDVLRPTLNFTYSQSGSSVQAQVAGVVQYADYLQNYYGNEVFGQLSGQMNWVLSPQRLNFDVEDYASVQPVSTRLSNAPSNLQQLNVLIAGPTLTFRIGDALQGETDLRYINTSASKTKDYDSQRGMGAFRIIRNISATDILSGNLEATHVDFDNVNTSTGTNNYDKYSAYLRYQRVLTHINFNVAVGGSRIDFSHGLSNHSGALVLASATWNLSPRNALTMGATSEITDSTSNLAQPPNLSTFDLTNPNIQVGSSVISPAVFRQTGLTFGYAYQDSRLTFTLASYDARLRQLIGNDLSRNVYGASIGATYLIRPLLTFGVGANYQVTEYLIDHSRDRDPAYTVFLSRQLTPHWSWNVTLNHNSRLATAPGFGYHENQVLFTLYYRR